MANLLGAYGATKVYKFSSFSSTIIDSFSLAVDGGLAWDGGNLLSLASTKVRKHSGFSATVLDSFTPPAAQPDGLSIDSEYNVLSGDYNGKCYKHQGFSSTITDSFAPATKTFGLGWDGTNLLRCVTSGGTDKYYKHNGFSATIIDSFTKSGRAYCLDFDGANLLAADYTTNLRTYKLSGFSATVLDSFSNPGGGTGYGLAWDAWPAASPDKTLTDALALSEILAVQFDLAVPETLTLAEAIAVAVAASTTDLLSLVEALEMTRADYIVDALSLAEIAAAQQSKITGVTRDENGDVLAGVNVAALEQAQDYALLDSIVSDPATGAYTLYVNRAVGTKLLVAAYKENVGGVDKAGGELIATTAL